MHRYRLILIVLIWLGFIQACHNNYYCGIAQCTICYELGTIYV